MSFAATHREWHLSIQNKTGAPYGSVHNATEYPDGRYLQQETVDAIANLATATESDCAAIAQLTYTVEGLTAELVTVNAKLVTSLPQATQTLNLLRRSRINPQLSAEAKLNGAFDYNRTPMAPPGTKVLIH